MPRGKLNYFHKQFLAGYQTLVEGNKAKLNIGILYKPDVLEVSKIAFDKNRWKDQLGDDKKPRYYKWSRIPLIVQIKQKDSGREFVIAAVHPKSKKTYSNIPVEREKEALENRKRIVAEGRRLHHILWHFAQNRGAPFDRFIVMGDINDGPWFDKYEATILRSGVESHIGRVYKPDQVLHSFIDLSNERGTQTTPKSWAAPQLDHMLFTHEMSHGTGLPVVVAGSGRIRNDLVNFSHGSGKTRDSDHCPVELVVEA